MTHRILAFDLGTSGCKASLYDEDGTCFADAFHAYPTFYPRSLWHEQRPTDWWDAVVASARSLLATAGVGASCVAAMALSGQSLAVVPLGADGAPLQDRAPIWSDARAAKQAASMFREVPEEDWYLRTGNGFPPALYSVFKTMWLRECAPEVFGKTRIVVGSKDYINYRLTGRVATDHSYASGSGVYSLRDHAYDRELIKASGLPHTLFPEIVPATDIIGGLAQSAAGELGLLPGTPVMAGGVDNSCMAVGGRGIADGRVYNSLGSSSWITVASATPLLDARLRPFVFDHVIPGLYISAMSIFGGGSSLTWVREQIFPDLVDDDDTSAYDRLIELADRSPSGSRGLLFIPTLAGGTALEGGPDVRGAFLGLDLRHTRYDIARAVLEGTALALRRALDAVRSMTSLGTEILVVGGASRNGQWRQLLADAYGMPVVKSTVDQQAAALGAAAIAAVGIGLWPDFSRIDKLHRAVDVRKPDPTTAALYEKLLPVYTRAAEMQAELGALITTRTG